LKEVFDELAEQMGTLVFKSAIREAIAVKEAQVMHKSIFEYAPKSKSAEDYMNFIEEFLGVIK